MTTYKKPVTEDDLRVTEEMIGRSFGNLKKAVLKVPSDIVRPVTDLVEEHPYATIAAAAGTGLIIHEAIRIATPKVVVKEVPVPVKEGEAEKPAPKKGPDIISQLTSQVVSMATPYAIAYLEKELANMFTGKKSEYTAVKTETDKEPIKAER
ncbi:hypothetical protein CUJ83_07030 [Methanocella sp. CWC-04]|uniref:Uncharacterized protein n=1 Tax=Methanooceanicella nereidis TaxID=2052831 RepID=A0AAP2RBY9_9EURY|nr:hypothetical protein [Methanocella sp. CWC-04]MCD1294751.1 hypothetical protein [Methanocella sp. CWC-04]